MTTPTNATTTPDEEERGKSVFSDVNHDPSPYIHDQYECDVCHKPASLECGHCKLFFCAFCANANPVKGLYYCPRCGYRLYEISETKRRFVGSRKPHKQMRTVSTTQKMVEVTPRIYDKGKILQPEKD